VNSVKVIVTDDEDGSVSASVKVTVVAKVGPTVTNEGPSMALIAGVLVIVVVLVLIGVILLIRKKDGAAAVKNAKPDEEEERPKATRTKKVKAPRAEEKPADKKEEE
jgi:mannitol-specific phosphotransferase system IIBC component